MQPHYTVAEYASYLERAKGCPLFAINKQLVLEAAYVLGQGIKDFGLFPDPVPVFLAPPTVLEDIKAVQRIRDTGLDCADWPQETLLTIVHAVRGNT